MTIHWSILRTPVVAHVSYVITLRQLRTDNSISRVCVHKAQRQSGTCLCFGSSNGWFDYKFLLSRNTIRVEFCVVPINIIEQLHVAQGAVTLSICDSLSLASAHPLGSSCRVGYSSTLISSKSALSRISCKARMYVGCTVSGNPPYVHVY